MGQFEQFTYKSIGEVEARVKDILPFAASLSALAAPGGFCGARVRNRIVFQPMEGCDAEEGGGPSELTEHKYLRFAEGAAGILWFEAVSMAKDGLSKPRQLLLTPDNVDAFAKLVDKIREKALRLHGFTPLIIMQQNFAGRMSNPEGVPQPLISRHIPSIEKDAPLPEGCIVSDERLEKLEAEYGQNAALAERAGFDGVDVKACHGYLLGEMLGAYARPGAYGGSFENRTRLLRNCIAASRAAVSGGFIVTARVNVYDGFSWPDGFGMKKDGSLDFDPEEPLRLARLLRDEYGIRGLNITMGNPYVNTHVVRPYSKGNYIPEENQVDGMRRLLLGAKAIKDGVEDLAIVCSGLSYLRGYAPHVAAGGIEEGWFDFTGFGRMALAYPEFANDVLAGKTPPSGKCCVCCGKCAQLLRAGVPSGCVVRDTAAYIGSYRERVK